MKQTFKENLNGKWSTVNLPLGLLRFLSACLSGKQTGQSLRTQCFQWLIIWRDELQCGTLQLFPAWHVVIWFKTFFMVLQWGKLQCQISPLAWDSRSWHLWAWRSNTSCCWISLRFSGSKFDKDKKNYTVYRLFIIS